MNSDGHTDRQGQYRNMSPAREKHNTSIILFVVCKSILNSQVSSARYAISMTSTTRTSLESAVDIKMSAYYAATP